MCDPSARRNIMAPCPNLLKSLRQGGPLAALLATLILAACSSDHRPMVSEPGSYHFDFRSGPLSEEAGFADYPAGEESFYELDSGWESVPGLMWTGGVYLNGKNYSDDLFMFLRMRLDGLGPAARYSADIALEIATNEGRDCIGIGGAPGESVFVKAGLSTIRPEAFAAAEGELMRMNIDKGNQSQGGADAVVLGDLAGTRTTCDSSRYERKSFDRADAMSVTPGPDGSVWLLVGTDSGFEGQTRVYVTQVKVILRPL